MATDMDSGRIPTVMGAGGIFTSARMPPMELQAYIRANTELESALTEDPVQTSRVRKAVRFLLDEYSDRVARAAVMAAQVEVDKEILRPMLHKASLAQGYVQKITEEATVLKTAVLRMTGGSSNEGRAKLNRAKYEADLLVVEKAMARQTSYQVRISGISLKIDVILEDENEATGDLEELATLQTQRSALEKERIYVEKGLMEHFDSNAKAARNGAKQYMTEFKVPDNLQQGKGKELCRNLKAYLSMRTPMFYALLPELLFCAENAQAGIFEAPPSKLNGYVGVSEPMRETYADQSLKLWEEIERRAPKDVIANIRKQFKYGLEEKKASCEVGDGVMAIFCLLALYRPSGLAYREQIKDKLAIMPSKFADGSCPASHVKTMWPVLQEAIDLGVCVQWSRIGRPIVTLLTERNNIFSRALADYADIQSIVDLDDSAVELMRMLGAVEQACNDLEEAGISTKRAAFAGWDAADRPASNSGACWYGQNCTRVDCTRSGHDAKGKGKGKSDTKGKGKGKGKSKGKGKGKSKGKGKDSKRECNAKDCPASGKGFRFCSTCHRTLMEKGQLVCKDGSTEKYTPKDASTTALRANSAIEQGCQGYQQDGEDSELFQFSPEGDARAMTAGVKRVRFTDEDTAAQASAKRQRTN